MIYYKNDDLAIRSMTSDDIEKIMSNYTEQGWNKPMQVIEGYYAKQNNNELKVFIAEYKNGIAGYTVLYPNAFYGPFKDKNIPEISDFVVFIKFQRNGIGNAILDQAERIASERSDRVSLGVGLHSGYGSAQRIYAKRGYVPDGTGVWYNNVQLEPYTDCINDDDLVLYLSKELRKGA